MNLDDNTISFSLDSLMDAFYMIYTMEQLPENERYFWQLGLFDDDAIQDLSRHYANPWWEESLYSPL